MLSMYLSIINMASGNFVVYLVSTLSDQDYETNYMSFSSCINDVWVKTKKWITRIFLKQLNKNEKNRDADFAIGQMLFRILPFLYKLFL